MFPRTRHKTGVRSRTLCEEITQHENRSTTRGAVRLGGEVDSRRSGMMGGRVDEAAGQRRPAVSGVGQGAERGAPSDH
jgi:hypothetical protein